jgi:predicted amino acid-binding ACT domain protein
LTFKADLRTAADAMKDTAHYRSLMWTYSEGIDAVAAEVFERIAARWPVLRSAALMAYGSYGSRRPSLASDVDLNLVIPDGLTVPREEIQAAVIDLGEALSGALRSPQDEKPLKSSETVQEIKSHMEFWEKDPVHSGDPNTGIHALRVHGLTARPVAGNTFLYRNEIRPFYAGIVKKRRMELLRRLTLERDFKLKQPATPMLEPDYKAGLGGVREYDNITWLSRFVYPWGSQGLVGLLGGWVAMSLEGRVSLKQLLRARGAYLRQARLRDRDVPYTQLTREEKIQYVQDAGILFDTLVSLLQSYWIQPGRDVEARRGEDPEYVPLFLASAGWRPDVRETVTAWRGQKITVNVRRPKVENMAEFTIVAESDRPGVLAVLSGLLAAQGLSIQAAEATYEGGRVTDRFFVTLPALKMAETADYADQRIEDIGRKIVERAEALFGDGVNIAGVAEDFRKKGLDYRFVLPEGVKNAQSLVFFHNGDGKRTMTLMTRDRAVGQGKDLKNGTGTLHVISRWLAENGYTILGNPSIRTQEGVVLNSFRLARSDGRGIGWNEERAVERALEEFLDRPIIEEKDFNSGVLLPGASPLPQVLAPWKNFPALRLALSPWGRAVLTGLGALILLAVPEPALAAQAVLDGASSIDVWGAGLGVAAVAVGRPRGGVNSEKVETLFRSGNWSDIQEYLRQMKSLAGRDPAAYVDGACILLLRLMSLTSTLPEAERGPAQTELREKFWSLAGTLTNDAVAGPGADAFTRNYIATVMLDNLASRALDTGEFDLAEALLNKSAEHQAVAATAAKDAPAKAFPRPGPPFAQ